MKKALAAILFVMIGPTALAQDSLVVERDTIFLEQQDTILLESYAKRYNPRKALLFAAIFPGAGQAYNKKYWKIPLVYGGIYLIGYSINHYNNFYTTYRAHLFYNLGNNLGGGGSINPATGFSTDQLRRIVDRARRERDLMVIVMGGMYLLQIVDAHVDAHLKEFDLNPNLRVGVEPVVERDALLGRQTGMALIFRF